MTKLQHKLSICVLGSVLATSLVTSALVIRSARARLEEDLSYAGRTLATTIASSFVETLLGEPDYPFIETHVRQLAQDSKMIVLVRVWETSGDKRKLIQQYPPDSAVPERENYRLFRSPVVAEFEGIPNERIGEVELGVSTERLTHLIKTGTWQLVCGATVSFALLVLIISVALKRTVLDPVQSLDRHARRIRAGKLEVPIEARTRDELGRLAGTMESMRLSLKESYARIERQVQELKELDGLKDEFLANTSHELKTPLNGIIGLTDGIASGSYGEVPDPCHEPLDMISSCARRLWEMTESILRFAQLGRSGLEPPAEPEPRLLARHLQEILVDLRVTGERKGVQILISVADDLEVTYRHDELEQLVRILVDNAVKFTERGWVEVIARRWQGAVPGFQLAVRDTGIGIRADAQKQIFEPFVQGFRHETRIHGGVGLGLAIAQRLVGRLGGHLMLESEEGKGTTFTLLVPEQGPVEKKPETLFVAWPRLMDSVRKRKYKALVSPSHSERALEGPRVERESEADAPGKGVEAGEEQRDDRQEPHILVTDDDPVNLEVVWQALRNQEFRITRAPDGETCLNVLRTQRVDLLLLDVMMPRVSGYDVLRTMKKEHLLERTAVIVVSAKTAPESVIKGLSMGASDYLGKPFHRQELLCRVNTQLQIRTQKDLLVEEVERKAEALETAKQANYVKTQFLANMSHEIRTPLNGILGFLNLALSRDLCSDEEERREYLENVHECTRSLMAIVNDILDVAKIESKQMRVELTKCKLREVVTSVFYLWQAGAQQKGLVMELEVSPGVPEQLLTDEFRLRQILNNLVGNSVKFTESGKIRVSAYIPAGSGSEVVEISVADTGIGIALSKVEDIFNAFTQADISMSRRFGGTGLGLSISRSLARMLGGDIMVESTQGEGSTFTLRLPLRGPGEGTCEAASSEDPARQEVASR